MNKLRLTRLQCYVNKAHYTVSYVVFTLVCSGRAEIIFHSFVLNTQECRKHVLTDRANVYVNHNWVKLALGMCRQCCHQTFSHPHRHSVAYLCRGLHIRLHSCLCMNWINALLIKRLSCTRCSLHTYLIKWKPTFNFNKSQIFLWNFQFLSPISISLIYKIGGH
jgi:hypothetical protein